MSPLAPGASFEDWFGGRPTVVTDAPGRVNLIGEHTDYNGGFVLPVATPQRTRVELRSRSDRLVRVVSEAMGPRMEAFVLGEEHPEKSWIDYVQGVTSALRRPGTELSGFDALVRSEVPVGSGLSSSAAFEVAILRALRIAFLVPMDDLELSLIAHRAETEFVGVPTGVMDPIASSLAEPESALLLDTRFLTVRQIPFPAAAELCVIDSGVRHSHATGSYRKRHEECSAAARALGVRELRDAQGRADDIAALPEPLNRRARHVVTENERVLSAAFALADGDLVLLGGLLVASQDSLRRDFEVSIPEVDRIVELAVGEPGAFGAKMTGGGFGGAVVVLCARGEARALGERVASQVRGATLVIPPAGWSS